MGGAIIANSLPWPLIVVIAVALVLCRSMLLRGWLEFWARIYLTTAGPLRLQFADEVKSDDEPNGIGPALLLVANVPRVGRPRLL